MNSKRLAMGWTLFHPSGDDVKFRDTISQNFNTIQPEVSVTHFWAKDPNREWVFHVNFNDPKPVDQEKQSLKKSLALYMNELGFIKGELITKKVAMGI